MKLLRVIGASSLMLGLLACSPKEEAADKATASPSAQGSAAQPMPDAGKVGSVTTTATGLGASPAEAVEEALKLAIRQVNGVSMDMSSEQVKAVLSVASGKDAEQLSAHAFAEYVSQQSGGVVTGFKLVKLEESGLMGKSYSAQIEATIAKFTAPASSNRLRIVVGPVHVDSASFQVAGQPVPSARVASEVRQQILNALTNTGRFTVLERDLTDDVQQELEMIGSGQTPSAERSKMSQAISADLVWTGQLNAFSYGKDSGNWALSQRVINVASRQVQLSSMLKGDVGRLNASGADPVRQSMESQMVERVVSAILVRTFPITVASREGNRVILSQGGQSVREGARYALVSLGQEIKDPQTGQSLGRTEYDCCEVVIDKVTPTMSQGHLENVRMPLEQIPPGGLQLRDLAPEPKAAAAAGTGNGTEKKAVAKKPHKAENVFAGDKDKW